MAASDATKGQAGQSPQAAPQAAQPAPQGIIAGQQGGM